MTILKPTNLEAQNNERSHANDPLHGIKLETILKQLFEEYGWEQLALRINIRCFKMYPCIKSSLIFLRKTPWARKKVEDLWVITQARKK